MRELLAKVSFRGAMVIFVVSGLIFALAFGWCVYVAEFNIQKNADEKIQTDIDRMQVYIEGELQRIEDIAFNLCGWKFNKSYRDAHGHGAIYLEEANFVLPTSDEVYSMMNAILDLNPQVCGVTASFEPGVFPEFPQGFSPYLSRFSVPKGERYRRQDLATIDGFDYRAAEYYATTFASDQPYWSLPFRESSGGTIITSYNLPLHGYGGRLIGVMSIDLPISSLADMCNSIKPFRGAVVTVLDQDYNVIIHPDARYLLKNLADIQELEDYEMKDSAKVRITSRKSGNMNSRGIDGMKTKLFFAPIRSANWTITIECPMSEIYAGLTQVKRGILVVSLVGILLMMACFVVVFEKMQEVLLAQNGIENELKVASDIQMGMLPKTFPPYPGRSEFDIYGFLKPAKEVGGDLFDFMMRDDRLFFCIGDVSGKGVPASLFMAVVRSLFRNVAGHHHNPGRILAGINQVVAQGNEQDMFCTMLVGVLDIRTGHLSYSNAGHNAPVLQRVQTDGQSAGEFLHCKPNIPVGVLEEFFFEQEEIDLQAGDTLFLYTDGVTESENAKKQLFGEEATLATLTHARQIGLKTPREVVEHVYEALQHHAANAAQSDDITMLCLEYKGV